MDRYFRSFFRTLLGGHFESFVNFQSSGWSKIFVEFAVSQSAKRVFGTTASNANVCSAQRPVAHFGEYYMMIVESRRVIPVSQRC